MRSLWLKLLGAFALVILIGAAADSLLVSRATRGQFSRFVTASGQAWARQLAPTLADYYARTGNWQGVEILLRSPWTSMIGMVPAAPSSESEGWVSSSELSDVISSSLFVVSVAPQNSVD